jgi:hypothetical protein
MASRGVRFGMKKVGEGVLENASRGIRFGMKKVGKGILENASRGRTSRGAQKQEKAEKRDRRKDEEVKYEREGERGTTK